MSTSSEPMTSSLPATSAPTAVSVPRKHDLSALNGLDLAIPPPRQSRRLSGLAVKLALAAGALALAGWGAYAFFFPKKEQGALITGLVSRSDLEITVSERGDLESSKTVDVRCEVEGRQAKIVEIAPEGVQVTKDQVVVRFDTEELNRHLRDAEIKVKTAEGKAKASKEELEVQKNKAATDTAKAVLDLTLAELARDKYLNAEYHVEVEDKKGAIALGERDLQEAMDKLEHYRKFVKQGFGTSELLRLKEFDVDKQKFYLSRDKAKLEMLQKYTFEEQKVKLTATAEDAKRNLDRTKNSSNALISKAQADYDAAEVMLSLEKNGLERIKRQIDKCTVKAPQEGILVYAKNRYYDPSMRIQAGGMVYYQQTLFSIPDLTKMQVKMKVHEAMVKKVKKGQKVEIRIDALPNVVLPGTVESVATLADSSGPWDERGVKEYVTIVTLDQVPPDGGLLPGMTGEAKILVSTLNNVLNVPVQAVTEKEGQHYAYVVGPTGVEKRDVTVGENNEKFVEVKTGLAEGEKVALDARARLALETKQAEEQEQQNGDWAAKPAEKGKAGEKAKVQEKPKPETAKPAPAKAVPTPAPASAPPAALPVKG